MKRVFENKLFEDINENLLEACDFWLCIQRYLSTVFLCRKKQFWIVFLTKETKKTVITSFFYCQNEDNCQHLKIVYLNKLCGCINLVIYSLSQKTINRHVGSHFFLGKNICTSFVYNIMTHRKRLSTLGTTCMLKLIV